MRIALVTESFYPATDGTTTTLKAVADRLVDTGHQVLVVAPGPGIGSYRGCPVARIRPLEPVGAQVRAALDGFRPDLVHVTSPGSLGRKALKHTRRNDIPSVVVEQGPALGRGRRLLAGQGRRPRRRGAGDVVVDGRPDGRVRRRAPASGAPGSTPTPSPRRSATSGSTTPGPGPGRRTVPRSWSGTPAACTSATAYAGWPRWPRSRASGWCVIGDGPQRDWLEAQAAGRQAGGTAADRRPDRSHCRASTCWCTPESTRPAATRCGRRPPAGCPSWRRGRAARPTWSVTSRAGCSTTHGIPADLHRAVSAVVADRHRSLLGRRARELAAAAHLDRRRRRAGDGALPRQRPHLGSLLDVRDGLTRRYLTAPIPGAGSRAAVAFVSWLRQAPPPGPRWSRVRALRDRPSP